MLKSIYIKNFVIIDEISLDFNSNLSVFTGETGAGKSILIDAIGLLCGDRANSNMISTNKNEAIIEGTFDFSDNINAINFLKENGFEIDEDFVITRIINKDNKSIVKINNRTQSLSFLKDLMFLYIDIHSQHDAQYLLKQNTHIDLLDKFINNDELVLEVKTLYNEYQKLIKEKNETIKEKYDEEELEFLKFQLDEIESANLEIDEDIEIENKLKEYGSISKTIEKAKIIFDIYNDDFVDRLFTISNSLTNVYSDKLNNIKDILYESVNNLDESISELRNYLDNLDISEKEIDDLNERSFLISKMKRKYGGSISKVLENKNNIANKISMINNLEEYLHTIDKRIDEAYDKFYDKASLLSNLRKEKTTELDSLIKVHLNDLMLNNAVFKTNIEDANPNSKGIDRVEFLISMNLGEDLKPLVKVASGGELSRLMLGLKVIFNDLQNISLIIFDEIDSGVSGPVATSIGSKMRDISKYSQVFVITHLAQVASFAKNHYRVFKKDIDGYTKTNISLLDENERIKELAILSTGEATNASISAASELYNNNKWQE